MFPIPNSFETYWVSAAMQSQEALPRIPAGTFFNDQHWPPYYTEENNRSAKAMKPRSDDVFICTYPKSGTTWIQHIVHQLLGKNDYDAKQDENNNVSEHSSTNKTENKAMWSISPMIERMGAVYADKFKSPRVLKSHFNYDDIPKGGKAKYIYSCRNPKDVLNSYYHHHKLFKMYDFEDGCFDVFFDFFMGGRAGVGDYFDHLLSWLEGFEKGEERVLFLKYEDMVVDLPSTVVQIGNFLGGNAAELVKVEENVAQIVAASTLSSMKMNQERWFPSAFSHPGDFIRKGGSGDWKNHFSYEQSNRMDMYFRQRCAGTEAADWWQTEMAWD